MMPYLTLNYIIRAGLGISVGPTVPLADTTQPGLVNKLSGLLTDYVGGDNACHNLTAVAATAFKGFISKSAAYTVSPLDSGYYIICTGGSWTLTLPPAAGGLNFLVRNDMGITAAAGAITLLPQTGRTINGQSSILLLAQQECTIVTDGTNWRTLGLAREVVLGSLNPSAVANQVIFLPSGYTNFELQISRLFATTSTPNLQFQCSLDGAAYGTTGYYGMYFYNGSSTAMSVATNANISTGYLTHWMEGLGRHLVNVKIFPGDSSGRFTFLAHSGGMWNGFVGSFILSGFWDGSGSGRVVSINIFPSAGTISAYMILKGIV
jgi:hypothetical protein